MFKICNVCKQSLSIDYFNKNKSRKDGLEYHCKYCGREKGKQYYQNNKDKVNARARNYQIDNAVEIKPKRVEYYQSNKDKILKEQRQYRKSKSDIIKIKTKLEVDNLGDRYVKQLIKRQLNIIDIPLEFIEAKKNQLLLNRLLRTQNND